MRLAPINVVAALALLVWGCRDPQCPPGLGKVEDHCYRLQRDAATDDAAPEGSGNVEEEEGGVPGTDLDADASDTSDRGSIDASMSDASAELDTPGDAESLRCLDGSGDSCIPSHGATCEAGQVWDALSRTCVGCASHSDCKDPVASSCDKAMHSCKRCTVDSDCSHIDGRSICSDGECVQCTQEKKQACLSAGTQFVCDPGNRKCDSLRRARGKSLCNACVYATDAACTAGAACVSSDECQEGQACVDAPVGAGKKVCLAALGSQPCPVPYTSATGPIVSAEGTLVRVCTFGTMTTCLAHAHYRSKRCGIPNPDMPEEDVLDSGDDAKCGEPNVADGFCSYSGGFKQYLCTVPCNATFLDCPNGERPDQCDTLLNPDRCTL